MGRESARQDLADVYRALLRRGDPLGTLANGPLLWSTYHDSGQFRRVAEGPSSARLELADLALPAAEICELFRGYFAEVPRVSGARAVEVTQIACRSRGAASRPWQAKWEPTEPSQGAAAETGASFPCGPPLRPPGASSGALPRADRRRRRAAGRSAGR